MAILNVLSFGANGNDSFNNQTALQNCFNSAAAGHEVYIPAGIYRHSGVLTIPNGVKRVFGDGATSHLKATTYGSEAIIVRANGTASAKFKMHDLKFEGTWGNRLSPTNAQKIASLDISHFEYFNLTVIKSAAGGMYHANVHEGHVHHCTIEDTRADSVHFTHGSSGIVAEYNTVRRSGDDGHAAVSYDPPRVNNITFRYNDIRFNIGGRGIGIIGSEKITAHDNVIYGGTQRSGSGGAGIMVATETAYTSPSVDDICIHSNHLVDCGSFTNAPGHGSIHVYSSVSTEQVLRVKIANNIIESSRRYGIHLTGSYKIQVNYYGNQWIDPPAFAFFQNGNTSSATVVSTTPVSGCPGTVVTPTNEVYVSSTTGNDANSGLSSGSPKASLSAAFALLATGSTLFLQGSFNIDGLQFPRSDVVFDSFGTGRYTLRHNTSGNQHGLIINAKSNITIKNALFTGVRAQVQVTGSTNIVFESCRWENYGTGGDTAENRGLRVNGAQSQNVRLISCEFDNTLGRAGAGDHVYVDHGCLNGMTVRDCLFIWPGNNSGDHLHLNSILNAEIFNNQFLDASSGKGAIITGVNAQNVNIHDNVFDNCGNYCWAVGWVVNFQFKNNLCRNVLGATWSQCVRLSWDDGMGGPSDGVVSDNIFVNCRCPIGAVDMYTAGTLTVIVEHNTFVAPTLRWLEILAPGPTLSNWRIEHNLVKDSAAAVISVSMPGLNFTDNWFENTPTSGTLPKTGSAGLDTNFQPTVAAVLAVPYGARLTTPAPIPRPPQPENVITGTAGNDTLTAPGGGLATLLDGLGGNDIFVFAPGCGHCEIGWFSRNPPVEQDRLDLSAFGWTSYAQFLANVTLEPIPGETYTDVPWNVLIIHFNENDSVWLNSVLDILEAEIIFAAPPAPGGQPVGARLRNFNRYGSEGVS